MSQTAPSIAIGQAADLPAGGLCAWRLPADPSCASVGRSLIRMAMTTIGLPAELIEPVTLAVSELTTNALHHGLRAGPYDPVVAPELWTWIRVTPVPQLVVAVFDTCRDAWPRIRPGHLLDEEGRGVGIVSMLADDWGAHPSRSRLGPRWLPGKAVWAAFALPGAFLDALPGGRGTAQPSAVARWLAGELAARGVDRVDCRDAQQVSLVGVPLPGGTQLNVWVEPDRFLSFDIDGGHVRRPIADLHDVAELLVRRIEEHHGERSHRAP